MTRTDDRYGEYILDLMSGHYITLAANADMPTDMLTAMRKVASRGYTITMTLIDDQRDGSFFQIKAVKNSSLSSANAKDYYNK